MKYLCSLYRKWGERAFKVDVIRRKYSRQMKLEAIHDIIKNKKSYYQKAIELMLTDPKNIGDWMEKYRKGGEKRLLTHIPEKHINIKVIKY
ncbi:MAG: transposase [Erysipelotrichales bacterium]|nr:transposase [Erysipelotrichales bacterium]